MKSSPKEWWIDDLEEVCVQFQVDLSSLVDGELAGVSSIRAIAHLEECTTCRSFFDDMRSQVRAHRDLANPDGLVQRFSSFLGSDLDAEVEAIDLVGRLSNIFYQLGKAYFLNAVDSNYRNRVFEKAVAVSGFQARGRGFVDGVLQSGRGDVGGLDWASARHILNGKLEKIESPLEKGRRLLQEALSADPTHEEARFYLSWMDKHEGKILRAAEGFRQLFRTAIDPANRGHAAIHLGKIYADQGDHRKAIACYRWITMSGLERDDARFFVALFNIGINWAHLGDQERSLQAFRSLLDRHSDRLADIIDLFAHSDSTQSVIAHQPGFAEALYSRCPELFHPVPSDSPGEEETT
ncbi:MAG TPA: tetratricopeptide repeat protein [Planctomycetes bacterium]|nr:tetratricopeptide repeat protein [Planctomycetota bacterium]